MTTLTDRPVAVPAALRAHPRATRTDRVAVAGVAGGVGATTVAVALGAVDRGVFSGGRAEVLVCRATGDSLIRVGRAARLAVAATGRKPVVAVTAADAAGVSRPVTARLRLLQPHAAAVVVLPYVRRWRDVAAPLDEVSSLLATPHHQVPRQLRRYAAALQELRSAISGHPPATNRPTTGRAPQPTLGRTP